LISSLDDQEPKANQFLIDVLVEAVQIAPGLDISELVERTNSEEEKLWMQTWPGEHYRLLPALAQAVGASRAVEVGTYKGQGTLALHAACPAVTTYDIHPYDSFPGTVIHSNDFEGGIEQRIGDLSQPDFFNSQVEVLSQAQLIFIDGPKDGVFEKAFAELLYPAIRGSGALVVWDDIRLMSMVDFWRWLPAPKLDATSIGHWSGTGLSHSQ